MNLNRNSFDAISRPASIGKERNFQIHPPPFLPFAADYGVHIPQLIETMYAEIKDRRGICGQRSPQPFQGLTPGGLRPSPVPLHRITGVTIGSAFQSVSPSVVNPIFNRPAQLLIRHTKDGGEDRIRGGTRAVAGDHDVSRKTGRLGDQLADSQIDRIVLISRAERLGIFPLRPHYDQIAVIFNGIDCPFIPAPPDPIGG